MGLRITSGPVLFGARSGATLTHRGAEAGKAITRGLPSGSAAAGMGVVDMDLAWDLTQPLRLRWSGGDMVLQCGECSASIPRPQAGEHLTIGLLNCIVYASLEQRESL